MKLIRQTIFKYSIKSLLNYVFKTFGFYKFILRIQKKCIALNLEEDKPRFSNYPYISGDSYLMISDVAYLEKVKMPIRLRQKLEPEICFIEVSVFNSLNDLETLYKYKKIIIHNGDNPPNFDFIRQLVAKKIYIFAVNVLRKSEYVYPIPIGLENLYLRRNGSMHYFNPLNISNRLKSKNKILLSSFSNSTNPCLREKLSKKLEFYGYKNNFYSIKNYRNELERSYFVISPPGNGFDCHRTWEAVYLKTIPVVLRNYFGFNDLDLPILVVDKYEEFLALSNNQKLDIYFELIKKSNDPIYIDWWIELIRK